MSYCSDPVERERRIPGIARPHAADGGLTRPSPRARMGPPDSRARGGAMRPSPIPCVVACLALFSAAAPPDVPAGKVDAEAVAALVRQLGDDAFERREA